MADFKCILCVVTVGHLQYLMVLNVIILEIMLMLLRVLLSDYWAVVLLSVV